MPKKNLTNDMEIEDALCGLMSSDDDDDDENEETFADKSSRFELDAKLNKIQSYSYNELLSVLSDDENIMPSTSHAPMVPPLAIEEHTLEAASNELSLPSEPTEEYILENPSSDILLPPKPTEELILETASSEPLLPPEPIEFILEAATSEPLLPPELTEEFTLETASAEPLPSYTQLLNKDRQWSNDSSNFSAPKFERPMTVNKQYNNRSTPLTYFQDMFPIELVDLIVRNTNIYAAYKDSNHWKDTTCEEINSYIGVVILMSINSVPDIKTYWSTDEFYNNPIISKVMPFKRFQKITENLHISNILSESSRTDPNYDKLCKIRQIIEKLNETFQQNCSPSQYNSIDESMIKFKGKSTMKQYMPKKPIKRGYKCWCRCDSKSGYLYCFQIYTGKANNSNEESLGCRVVTDLCQNVPEDTLIAFDNFFTSLPLMEILHSKKMYAVGTVRINRKGLPDEISKKNKELKLKPGEFIFKYSHPVSCIKWMDTKDVHVVTTAFDPKVVEVIKRTQKDGSKKEMFCPIAIKKYTDYMGGVDLFDHYRSSYPLGRKSRKYWHRIFWFLLEAAVVNSYIVYRQKSCMTHKDFRLRLGRLLINNFTSKKINTPIFKNKKGGLYGVPNEIRLLNVGEHMPQDNFKFRRCRFCSTRVKEKRSRFVCKTCKVPICPECFDNFYK